MQKGWYFANILGLIILRRPICDKKYIIAGWYKILQINPRKNENVGVIAVCNLIITIRNVKACAITKVTKRYI